jgi:cell division protease FtsH
VGYGVLFGILTLQDRFAGPQAVPYTEFKIQVSTQNVKEVFARGNTIQGALKQAQTVPGDAKGATYEQFTTERPTFAADDLFAELSSSAATVRATPLVQERGFLTNLLISMAPILLLFGFYFWMFKRTQKAMGGGLGAMFGSGGVR